VPIARAPKRKIVGMFFFSWCSRKYSYKEQIAFLAIFNSLLVSAFKLLLLVASASLDKVAKWPGLLREFCALRLAITNLEVLLSASSSFNFFTLSSYSFSLAVNYLNSFFSLLYSSLYLGYLLLLYDLATWFSFCFCPLI
jgi:hypothetical protein